MNTRRHFLRTAAAGTAWLAARDIVSSPLSAQTSESRVEVLLNEPIGRIAPEIYGHFVEHLGGVVYDGIWVGEKSRVPNIGGLRKDLVDALAKIKPGVIRWPGGCFADQYDWRDGIGPREKRPKRTNFWLEAAERSKTAPRDGPTCYDPNEFGTIEFVRFSKLTGAQPYFAANVRSLPALEFARWVEYCNAPAGSTTLAEQRAADGEPDPLNVRFWGVGNESWGCGGNFLPEDYATEYRRHSAWLPGYGMRLSLVGSGPNGDSVEWTRRFFKKAAEGGVLRGMWGWALHHYAWNVSGGRTTEWLRGKGDALKFDAEQYYEILREANQMESLIQAHWNAMRESDPRHEVKLVVDEWGAWYAPGTEPFQMALLGQQSTMRDAVLAGLTLDTFNRHADKVALAAIAQLVNCLQSPFLAHEDKFCVTPTYHVFAMYAAHQGAQSVRSVFTAPEVKYSRNAQPATLPGLAGSASLSGNHLTLTVTNPSLDQPREAQIVIRGGAAQSIRAVTLAASDVHAHNTFEAPRAVEPKTEALSTRGSLVLHRFPPASVTKLEITLSS
ncbi:MAG: alpha-L-arabinofuranosidase C-terminal domain-containing protein [Bryobacteraceae bacterium]|jgi:alpha-N-arabinofuranosidase